jgi:hypothetical protein
MYLAQRIEALKAEAVGAALERPADALRLGSAAAPAHA